MAALLALPVPPEEVVIVTDRPPSGAEAAAAGVSWRFGDAGIASLRIADCVIRSPGISRYREDAQRIALATRVTTGTNLWFAEHAGDPIIAVTGYGQEDDRCRSREAGFNHHLVKPIDYNVLVTLIGQSQYSIDEL
ncbi:MAG: hypothetical protein ABSE84_03475 [Isosphaeraceae bacterium]